MIAANWLDFASTIFTVIIAAGAVYAGVRRWVQRVAKDTHAARRQLEPAAEGTTVAGLVEQSANVLPQIQASLADLTTKSDANRDLALSAQTLARSAHERLDAHLAGHKET